MPLPVRRSALVALLAAACTAGRAPIPQAATEAEITEGDLRTRLEIIAHDSLQGRESGTIGNYKAAEYVAAEFKRLGLEPAGENGTYFQAVPLHLLKVDPASRITAEGTPLALGRDWVPAQGFAPPLVLDSTPVVYGGKATDSTTWIRPADARGKVVVLDVPPGLTMRGVNLAPARWRGAAALAPVILELLGPELVATRLEGRPVLDTTRVPGLLPVLWLSRPAALTLLGADFLRLQPGAQGKGLTGRADFTRDPVPHPARNVIAVLRGSDPALRAQYVSLSAHNDHVGFDHAPVDHDSLRAYNRVIRPMGADSPNRTPTAVEWSKIRILIDSLRRVRPPRLDSIRNGADDDGSGTAALLEVAEAFAHAKVRPRRSILFVNHVAEEAGLYGSAWFTDHPTVPRDSIVAEVDQDMVGRGRTDDFPLDGTGAGSPQYLEVVGAWRLSRELGDSLRAVNARQPVPFEFNLRYDAPGHPLQYYCRADHYNYARYGIPAMALSRGEHLDYHQVTDEAQYIDYPDFARVVRMVHALADVLGRMPRRPALSAPKPADPHAPCVQ
jgi:hypothetical protein